MSDFTVFAKEPGGKLMRFLACGHESYIEAISAVKAEVPMAKVFIDLSLTTPTLEQETV